jgi:hypothetical protein
LEQFYGFFQGSAYHILIGHSYQHVPSLNPEKNERERGGGERGGREAGRERALNFMTHFKTVLSPTFHLSQRVSLVRLSEQRLPQRRHHCCSEPFHTQSLDPSPDHRLIVCK